MYIQDQACISIGNNLTETFRVSQRGKQGCSLSPLLFNIFISDLPESLNEGASSPVRIDETKSLNYLIWADDLLILSESKSGFTNNAKEFRNILQKQPD